jgi:hypothetical protein
LKVHQKDVEYWGKPFLTMVKSYQELSLNHLISERKVKQYVATVLECVHDQSADVPILLKYAVECGYDAIMIQTNTIFETDTQEINEASSVLVRHSS